MKAVIVFFIASLFAFFEVGCVNDPATGKSKFQPIEAAKIVMDKVDEIPDETKASALEALAWLLGATGVGGGAGMLISRGASYYRNRAIAKNLQAQASTNAPEEGDEGKA